VVGALCGALPGGALRCVERARAHHFGALRPERARDLGWTPDWAKRALR
jgi:hypothetical protein